jgi:hypothetical protein
MPVAAPLPELRPQAGDGGKAEESGMPVAAPLRELRSLAADGGKAEEGRVPLWAVDGTLEGRVGNNEVGNATGMADRGNGKSKIEISPSRGPATLESRRERKRVRREMERREIQRRVEALLMAGETSARKIIGDVMMGRAASRRNGMSGQTRGP